MRTTATLGYVTMHREVSSSRREPGPGHAYAAGYHGPREDGPFGPGPGRAPEWFEDNRSQDEDSLWMAGQVLTLADDKAAQIAQEAQHDAAAMLEAAEREAAAIREAAQREAAEQKARLDWMLDELGKVLAASVAAPALPQTAPAHPGEPVLPKRTPPAAVGPAGAEAAGATPALPTTMHAPLDTAPGTRSAKSATGPTRAPTKSASKPVSKQQRLGRQKRAMRIAKYGTAAAVIFALTAGAVEISQHGYGFFVFRENGQGDTPNVQPGRLGDNRLDTDFLAQQARAAQEAKARQALKGRHHKTSPPAPSGTTATSTTGG